MCTVSVVFPKGTITRSEDPFFFLLIFVAMELFISVVVNSERTKIFKANFLVNYRCKSINSKIQVRFPCIFSSSIPYCVTVTKIECFITLR